MLPWKKLHHLKLQISFSFIIEAMLPGECPEEHGKFQRIFVYKIFSFLKVRCRQQRFEVKAVISGRHWISVKYIFFFFVHFFTATL